MFLECWIKECFHRMEGWFLTIHFCQPSDDSVEAHTENERNVETDFCVLSWKDDVTGQTVRK